MVVKTSWEQADQCGQKTRLVTDAICPKSPHYLIWFPSLLQSIYWDMGDMGIYWNMGKYGERNPLPDLNLAHNWLWGVCWGSKLQIHICIVKSIQRLLFANSILNKICSKPFLLWDDNKVYFFRCISNYFHPLIYMRVTIYLAWVTLV